MDKDSCPPLRYMTGTLHSQSPLRRPRPFAADRLWHRTTRPLTGMFMTAGSIEGRLRSQAMIFSEIDQDEGQAAMPRRPSAY